MPKNQGLTHRQAEAITTPGRYGDGRSLYLLVSTRGKSWVFRYRAPGGKAREMGLGAFPDVSLSDARIAVADARAALKAGHDPIQARNVKRLAEIEAAAKIAAKGALTFGDYTKHVLPDLLADSHNEKHRWAYARRLELYAATLNRMVLAKITTADVAAALKPIWRNHSETARRVRCSIERIMARAIVEGKHAGPNPGTWLNNLEHAGLGRERANVVKHMAAVPYEDSRVQLQ